MLGSGPWVKKVKKPHFIELKDNSLWLKLHRTVFSCKVCRYIFTLSLWLKISTCFRFLNLKTDIQDLKLYFNLPPALYFWPSDHWRIIQNNTWILFPSSFENLLQTVDLFLFSPSQMRNLKTLPPWQSQQREKKINSFQDGLKCTFIDYLQSNCLCMKYTFSEKHFCHHQQKSLSTAKHGNCLIFFLASFLLS